MYSKNRPNHETLEYPSYLHPKAKILNKKWKITKVEKKKIKLKIKKINYQHGMHEQRKYRQAAMAMIFPKLVKIIQNLIGIVSACIEIDED